MLFVIPPRAPFNAEPRGLGTWQRQRLSSYLLDVAAAARVSIRKILRYHVAWRRYEPERPFGKSMRLEMVNGPGPLAQMWVSRVSLLVGRDDIDDLTLLPFAHAL